MPTKRSTITSLRLTSGQCIQWYSINDQQSALQQEGYYYIDVYSSYMLYSGYMVSINQKTEALGLVFIGYLSMLNNAVVRGGQSCFGL